MIREQILCIALKGNKNILHAPYQGKKMIKADISALFCFLRKFLSNTLVITVKDLPLRTKEEMYIRLHHYLTLLRVSDFMTLQTSQVNNVLNHIRVNRLNI